LDRQKLIKIITGHKDATLVRMLKYCTVFIMLERNYFDRLI